MDDYITLDGVKVSRKSLEAAGWTPPPEAPEPDLTPTEADIGALCKFWDMDGGNENITILRGIFTDMKYPFATILGPSYRYARLLTKAPIRFIPWSGGKCPVPDDTPTLILFEDGGIAAPKEPQLLAWIKAPHGSRIIGYIPLKFIGVDRFLEANKQGENDEML